MANNIIYFAGSLPMLLWDGKPAMTLAEFDAEASRLLEPADARKLKLADAQLALEALAEAPATVKRYCDWETALRNNWLEFRKNVDPEAGEYHRGYPDAYGEIAPVLSAAAACQDPLEAEQMIDRLRWTRLDELESGHLFDLDYLAIYRLKLAILLKYDALTPEAGNQVLDEVLDSLVQKDVFNK